MKTIIAIIRFGAKLMNPIQSDWRDVVKTSPHVLINIFLFPLFTGYV
jgi:hypothetical protein